MPVQNWEKGYRMSIFESGFKDFVNDSIEKEKE